MEELDFQNILTPEQIANLFTDNGDNGGGQPEPEPKVKAEESKEKKGETEENAEEPVDVGTLFGGDPEGVGEEDNSQGKEGAGDNGGGSSPNVFSSIASALAEQGVFQTLDEKDISGIDSVEKLLELFDDEVHSRLDETRQRIDDILAVGVEPDQVRAYENTLAQLNSITPESLSKEGKEAENLRRNLIYLDYINRGFSKEKAERELKKSFNAGTDIEDAKDALLSCKQFYTQNYQALINDAKAEQEQQKQELAKEAGTLQEQILGDNEFFGGLKVDKGTRRKIYENISKPVWTDPETGQRMTALQKYEIENRTEFLKNIGLLFTLTDGFKNIDRLVKGKVTEEKNKSVKALESMLTGNPEITGEMRNMGVLNNGERKGKSIFDQGWTIGKV